ncbi:ladderlectin-like protein, partial [Lates japonicus]
MMFILFIMRTLLILSVVLCAALSIQAATVVPAEAAAVQQTDKSASEAEVEADTNFTADRPDVLPQEHYVLAVIWQSQLSPQHMGYNFLQRMVKTGVVLPGLE